MTCHNGRLAQQKSVGLVQDVFHSRHMQRLVGNMGIGHVRYPTAGSSGPALAQPFYVNSPYGIALAHNGNLTNTEQLSNDLFYRIYATSIQILTQKYCSMYLPTNYTSWANCAPPTKIF